MFSDALNEEAREMRDMLWDNAKFRVRNKTETLVVQKIALPMGTGNARVISNLPPFEEVLLDADFL